MVWILAGGRARAPSVSLLTPITPYWVPVPDLHRHGPRAWAQSLAPMTAAVMNSVGQQRAGLGSAMTNTSREVGGVLGIALLGAILTTQLKDASSRLPIAHLGLNDTAALGDRGGGQARQPRRGSGIGLSPSTQAAVTTGAFNDRS